MDLVVTSPTTPENPAEFAFWTADHCLKFADANAAELYLFDPAKRTYLRLKVELPELERYKRGVRLFQERLRTEGSSDAQAQADLNAFIEAGKRNSVTFNGAPLIERGTPFCKDDTANFKATKPDHTVTCSSVLDLARLSGVVSEESMQRPEVADAIQRMKVYLKEMNDRRFELIEKLTNEQDKVGQRFFIHNWRPKITALTFWRRYETESALIEKVRQCANTDFSGICAQPFKDFFNDALSDYKNKWNPPLNQDFQTALKNEVYADPLPNTNAKHNLKWLLSTQSGLGRGMENNPILLADVKFSTNFSMRKKAPTDLKELPVLGTSGGLFYGLASPLTIYSTKPSGAPMKIYTNTILINHTQNQTGGMNFFLQPGDSGSLFLLGGLPLAVVATVDGQETSGGTSLLPLPNNNEEEDEMTRPKNALSCK
jgi:hypothetical protein